MVLEWFDLGALHNLGIIVMFAFQNYRPSVTERPCCPDCPGCPDQACPEVMDENSFLEGWDWVSVGDWFHVFDIGDQNTVYNISELIDIIQKCQIDFDISLQTISYQTQTKGTWQSAGITFELLDDIDDSSADWLNFSDDVTAQLNQDNSTCMTRGTVCSTA